ncbi:conjugal transfer ATP-binding protein TraC [Modicisalibacter xianhensis]|uniref:Conjugal transfer ATP-binding protein TraC n=1 Tax=Modicisalibacter xianhensis TaxID=442341 RepID=A0A4R8FW51_9GAMM|nr:type IV secretion system protein TraC [Halomonas xianhensis]TDX26801.1 conjugal transfer ATP-binding protein TraC [Halomonas xianhensis]
MTMITVRHKRQERLIPQHMRASSLIPVLAYDPENHLFFGDDQSLSFAFHCEPLTYGDDKIQERVTGLLNHQFPANTMLQFILFRSPDINTQMNKMLSLRDDYRHPLLSRVVEERVEFLRRYTTENLEARTNKGYFNNGLVQDLKLVITCKIPLKGQRPEQAEIEELINIRNKVESALNTVGVQPQPMTAKSFRRLVSTMLNWGPQASWRHGGDEWEQDKPLCDQLFDYDTDITLEKDHLRLGEHYVKALSAKKLPPLFYFGNALAFVGDITGGSSSVKENYMIVTNVFYPESQKTKDSLERKRKFTINQAYGPLLKFVPVLAEKKQSFDALYDSLNDGASPVQISYTAFIFAPTKKRMQAAAASLAGFWRENRFTLLEDKFIGLPLLINSLPLCSDRYSVRDLNRHKTMTSEQASVLLPIFGEWKGTGTFHAALLSRNGQLMSMSLHDSNTNKNLVIAAESGSGKSFWANELLLSYLSEGAQVWVIDAGKSYQNLCDILDGDFLQFGESADICLNPFELVQNYIDEEDALVSLVSAMASHKGQLDEFQIASLKQIMSSLWDEHGQSLKVDHIEQACLAAEDQRVRDIGAQLFVFTSRGGYGNYFAHDNNVKFQKQFTVLELDELQGRKHLRQVVLLQLIYQIQQEVFLGERNRKKVVFIDEAWDLLKQGEVSVFIEHAYRKFRKYGGSVIIATQSINDLYENEVGRAIAENSASMHLLGQTEETVESVRREGRLTLSEGGFNMLRTVHTVAGVYSEIFVKSKSGMGVGRLIVGEFQKLLYSTDPVDVNAIAQHRKRGLGVAEAIQAVLHERGLTDAA